MSTPRSIAAIALSTAFLVAGCGAAADKAAETAVEKAIESETGGNVDIDTKGDGSVDIKTDDGTLSTDGEGNVNIESKDGSMSSTGGEIPKDWPAEVPLPDDLVVTVGSAFDSSDGFLVSVVGTTQTSAEDVLASLKDALSDWDLSGEVTSTSNGSTLTSGQFETEGRRLNFAASEGPDETSLTIGHTTLAA